MPSSREVKPGGKVIAIVNGKGGVGKTTLSVHLAEGLAERGLKTLLMDVDPQESTTWWSEAQNEPRLLSETVRLHEPRELGRLISPIRVRYQVCVIDTAPTLLDDALEHVLKVADLVLVPTAPDTLLELARSIRTARTLEKIGKPYLVVLTRVDMRAWREAQDVMKELTKLNLRTTKNIVRQLKAYRVAANAKTIAWRSGHASARAAGEDMKKLVDEVLMELGILKGIKA